MNHIVSQFEMFTSRWIKLVCLSRISIYSCHDNTSWFTLTVDPSLITQQAENVIAPSIIAKSESRLLLNCLTRRRRGRNLHCVAMINVRFISGFTYVHLSIPVTIFPGRCKESYQTLSKIQRTRRTVRRCQRG